MKPGLNKLRLQKSLRELFNGRINLALVVPAIFHALANVFTGWIVTLMEPLFPPIYDAIMDVLGNIVGPAACFAIETAGAATWVYAQWAFGLGTHGGDMSWATIQQTIKSFVLGLLSSIVRAVINFVVQVVHHYMQHPHIVALPSLLLQTSVSVALAPLTIALTAADAAGKFVMNTMDKLKNLMVKPIIKARTETDARGMLRMR